MRNCLTVALVLLTLKVGAAVQPTVKYLDNNAEYSIQWDTRFAQINNLTPEIEINGNLFSGVDIPTIWKLETKDRLIITVFNWLDKDVTKSYNLKNDFELSSSNYQLTELWTKKLFEIKADKLTLVQPAHSVKIFEFEKKE